MTHSAGARGWFPDDVAEQRELIVSLVAIGLLAGWAAHQGTLPGQAFGLPGLLLTMVIWAALFMGVARAYRSVARGRGGEGRAPNRQVAAGLVLALVATQLCRLLVRHAVGPAAWQHFFYLEWLLPPALLVLAWVLLLPRDTVELYRVARADPVWSTWLAFGLLLATAAALTSLSDMAFEWRGLDLRLRHDLVEPNAWVTNVTLLFAAYVLAFAVTRRVAAAVFVVSPVYLVLGIATLAKIRFMHAAVQPLDLLRLPEFAPLFDRFFGTASVVALAMALLLWLGALAAVRDVVPWGLSPPRRLVLGVAALAVLLSVPAAMFLAPTHPALGEMVSAAGAPQDLHREKARANGVLLSFLSELHSAFVPAPTPYSARAVAAAVARRHASDTVALGHARSHVNLILYVVESFMDPDDLALHYTSDPIPNVRAAAGGRISSHGIVPERFGGSANTEFEVLTGMTMAYLPEGSLPFRQYIRHPVPSLPRFLSERGYSTTAVQADAKYYYNREQAYDLLGFQDVVWLNDSVGVERAARPGWPADQAVVNAVIAASRGHRPFFVFAFPSSTHSPYNSGVYRSSTLDVTDPIPGDTAGEVKEYINALHVSDQAIGALIEHFRREPDSTVIAIVGDHLAPLSAEALSRFFDGLSGLNETEQARRTRRVPLVVWANFPLPTAAGELSLNGLPALLLEEMNVRPEGLLAVSDEVRKRLPVVSSYVQTADGRMWSPDSVPADARVLLDDYRLLQYDALLGRRYALLSAGSGAGR